MPVDEQLRSSATSSSSSSSSPCHSPLRSSTKLVRSITKSSAKNLRRALSLDTSLAKKSNEMLIDASNNVPSEELWDNLRLLKSKKNNVTDVRVKGILMKNTSHQDKIPMVQELAFHGRFDTFLFLETIAIDDYPVWKERKDAMMQERYKVKKSLRYAIVWQAQVSVAKGTSLESLEDFLSSLQGDLSCGDVSFVTTSSGRCESSDDLIKLIHKNDRKLIEDISVVVSCGCGENDEGLRLLENSTKIMSRMLAQKGKRRRNTTKTSAAAASQETSKSMNNDGSSSSSSSKESLKRATSWDDFCTQNRERLYMQRAQRMEALASRQQNQKTPTAA